MERNEAWYGDVPPMMKKRAHKKQVTDWEHKAMRRSRVRPKKISRNFWMQELLDDEVERFE